MIKNLYLKVCFIFLSGVLSGMLVTSSLYRKIPSTIFSHPVITYHAMIDLPIGSMVYPVESEEAKKLFSNVVWDDKNYGVIIDYRVIISDGRPTLVCRIVDHKGIDDGYEFNVGRHWIKNRN